MSDLDYTIGALMRMRASREGGRVERERDWEPKYEEARMKEEAENLQGTNKLEQALEEI